ncbi:hypothetical protein JOQ06_012263 [Pogonophryne albipinna]|uniref:SPIN-DOC-like zinc-finger domain-containing protein n=1 Tax=Pogonophryne albipinna TaxID=1090488 RepID=A0AAD6FR80_9TELE|nr:hypothetical protein JOQ06_012263 [Pogonophryne albipinna]
MEDPGPSRKKRCVSEEKRKFQEKWSNAYFVLPQGSDKVICLICKQVNAMLKEYNIKRHYDTNHKMYDKFMGKERRTKLEQLQRGLTVQQSVFTNLAKSGEAVTQASYVVAHEIARRSKPFSDGEFVRDCILKVADIVCPEQKSKFRDISLSNDTVTRRIEDLANDLKEQLGLRVEGLGKGSFSIALDESTDISDTAQLLIFRTVTEDFEIGEELLSMESIKDRTRGIDICDALCRSLDAYNVELTSMVDKNHNLMEKLQEEFHHRFSDFSDHEKSFNLFQDPFTCAPEEEPAEMQFELIDPQESSEARAAYRDKNLIEFYKGLSPSTYPALRQHAIRMASLFGSTYICEKTFSTMAINKSKLRSRLTDAHLHAVLRIATTEMEPDIKGIVANRRRHHKSHSK